MTRLQINVAEPVRPIRHLSGIRRHIIRILLPTRGTSLSLNTFPAEVVLSFCDMQQVSIPSLHEIIHRTNVMQKHDRPGNIVLQRNQITRHASHPWKFETLSMISVHLQILHTKRVPKTSQTNGLKDDKLANLQLRQTQLTAKWPIQKDSRIQHHIAMEDWGLELTRWMDS